MKSQLPGIPSRLDVWQAGFVNKPGDSLSTGHPNLDAALHYGGWPRASLSELHMNNWGSGEMQLLAPLLARCSREYRRLFFICPPYLPYAPALHMQGIRLDRVLIVSTTHSNDTLWAVEQILRSKVHACLLAWLPEPRIAYRDLRRIQLATRNNHGPIFLFRSTRVTDEASPAALQLRLHATSENIVVEVLKQPGGWAGQRILIAREPTLLQTRIDPAMLPVTQIPTVHC